jgi:hypothetical protein
MITVQTLYIVCLLCLDLKPQKAGKAYFFWKIGIQPNFDNKPPFLFLKKNDFCPSLIINFLQNCCLKNWNCYDMNWHLNCFLIVLLYRYADAYLKLREENCKLIQVNKEREWTHLKPTHTPTSPYQSSWTLCTLSVLDVLQRSNFQSNPSSTAPCKRKKLHYCILYPRLKCTYGHAEAYTHKTIVVRCEVYFINLIFLRLAVKRAPTQKWNFILKKNWSTRFLHDYSII